MCFELVTNKHTNTKTNESWVTLGIRISCVKKRELYLLAKQSNDPVLLKYVKRYKKIVKKVCNAAKLNNNSIALQESDNPRKTARNVVNNEFGHKTTYQSFSNIMVGNKTMKSGLKIAGFINLSVLCF